MYIPSLTLALLFLHGVATSAATLLEPRATCPLTEVNAYRYGCAQLGWVQTPSYLKTMKGISNLDDCAKPCQANTASTKSYMRQDSKKCYLYDKYLDAMAFTTDNFEDGTFYERECFTTDCNTIKACKGIDGCTKENGYDYYYYYYTDFGCGYGVTAKLDQFSPTEKILKSGLTACQAASACGNKAPMGSFVISYYLPQKRWICTLYKNQPDDDYLTLHEQHINSMTLTSKNSSIGASYGYWLYDEYAADRR